MQKKRIFLLPLILAVLTVFVMFLPDTAEAAVNKDNKRYVDLTSDSKKYGINVNEFFEAWTDDVKSVKSYNTSVVKFKKVDGDYYLFPKKAGKCKITVKFSDAGKIKTTVYVQKYANPLKAFSVGSTSFVKRYKSNNCGQYGYTPGTALSNIKGELTVTAASGWSLKKIQKYDEMKGKWKTLKNHKTYSLNPISDRIVITLKDKKTKFIRTITLSPLG